MFLPGFFYLLGWLYPSESRFFYLGGQKTWQDPGPGGPKRKTFSVHFGTCGCFYKQLKLNSILSKPRLQLFRSMQHTPPVCSFYTETNAASNKDPSESTCRQSAVVSDHQSQRFIKANLLVISWQPAGDLWLLSRKTWTAAIMAARKNVTRVKTSMPGSVILDFVWN